MSAPFTERERELLAIANQAVTELKIAAGQQSSDFQRVLRAHEEYKRLSRGLKEWLDWQP